MIEQDEEAALPLVTVPGQVSIPDWILRQDEDEDLKLVKKWVKDRVKPSKEEIQMKPRSVHIYRQLFELSYIGHEGLLVRSKGHWILTIMFPTLGKQGMWDTS